MVSSLEFSRRLGHLDSGPALQHLAAGAPRHGNAWHWLHLRARPSESGKHGMGNRTATCTLEGRCPPSTLSSRGESADKYQLLSKIPNKHENDCQAWDAKEGPKFTEVGNQRAWRKQNLIHCQKSWVHVHKYGYPDFWVPVF